MHASVAVLLTVVQGAGTPTASDSSRALKLARVLEARDRSGRGRAFVDLQLMGPTAVAAVPSLLCLIEEEIPDAAVPHGGDANLNDAKWTLARIGQGAVAPILDAVGRECGESIGHKTNGRLCRLQLGNQDGSEEDRQEYCTWVRVTLAEALSSMGPAVVPELVAGLQRAGKHRQWVALALGKLGEAGAPAVSTLTSYLYGPDIELRLASARALGGIGPPATAAVPALRLCVFDTDARVRKAAASALAAITP